VKDGRRGPDQYCPHGTTRLQTTEACTGAEVFGNYLFVNSLLAGYGNTRCIPSCTIELLRLALVSG
jgi:hypothetical protein